MDEFKAFFFRQSTKAVADQLGAVGWVKNCSDGTVEALFQASPSIIQDLKLFIQRGPSKAPGRRSSDSL